MIQNQKILKIGIIAILITLIICLGLSLLLKLDKPVVLQSYLELDMPLYESGYYGDRQFELKYITNANDSRVVDHIEFEEAPELIVYASEYNSIFGMFDTSYIPGEVQGPYSIRTVAVNISANEIKDPINEIHLTKAKLHFTEGDIITADIGDIVLYEHNYSDEHLDFFRSNSSSDGTNESQMRVKEDITLLKIESPNLKNVENFIEFKIDGVDFRDIAGLKYLKDTTLRVNSKFDVSDDPSLRYNTYNIDPRLYIEDNEGNVFTYRTNHIFYRNHDYNLKDIIVFLRARGEI